MAASAGYSTFIGDASVGFLRAWINFGAVIAAEFSEEILFMSKW